jgi:DNA-binding transcriptional regulator YdaS (Cro superfamily)
MQGVYRNVLRHAASIAGEEPLARRLRVSASALASWLSGGTPIPSGVFLAVADYLAEIRPPDGAKAPGSERR